MLSISINSCLLFRTAISIECCLSMRSSSTNRSKIPMQGLVSETRALFCDTYSTEAMSFLFSPDYYAIKKNGLSEFQNTACYLSASLAQTVVDNPITAWRQLQVQLAKEASTGQLLDPKVVSQQVRQVFYTRPLTASLSGLYPRLVGVAGKRVPKFGILMGYSYFMGEDGDIGVGAATAASILSAPVINIFRTVEKQQRVHLRETGMEKPVSTILRESASQRFLPLFRGTTILMGHSLASALLGLAGQPKLMAYIQHRLNSDTSLGKAASNLIASCCISPIYVIVTNPLTQIETILQTASLTGRRLTIRDALQRIASDARQFGLRGLFRGQSTGIAKAIISLTVFHQFRITFCDLARERNRRLGYA